MSKSCWPHCFAAPPFPDDLEMRLVAGLLWPAIHLPLFHGSPCSLCWISFAPCPSATIPPWPLVARLPRKSSMPTWCPGTGAPRRLCCQLTGPPSSRWSSMGLEDAVGSLVLPRVPPRYIWWGLLTWLRLWQTNGWTWHGWETRTKGKVTGVKHALKRFYWKPQQLFPPLFPSHCYLILSLQPNFSKADETSTSPLPHRSGRTPGGGKWKTEKSSGHLNSSMCSCRRAAGGSFLSPLPGNLLNQSASSFSCPGVWINFRAPLSMLVSSKDISAPKKFRAGVPDESFLMIARATVESDLMKKLTPLSFPRQRCIARSRA